MGLALIAHSGGGGQGFFFPPERGDTVTAIIDLPGDGAVYTYTLGDKPAAHLGDGIVALR